MRDPQLEREGTGSDYPTMVVQAQRAAYEDSLRKWTLKYGRVRMLAGARHEVEMEFDSLRLRNFVERPEDLLAEAKKPQEMRYGELGRYIQALERSGGDGRKLRVERALKIAIPFTCIIIALFGAPLANGAPRASGAYGVAVALGTTVGFLILVQLSQAFGTGGLMPPTIAAWVPNMLFGVLGLWLLARVKT
jgi:lipopolysaccharide export system permease protein